MMVYRYNIKPAVAGVIFWDIDTFGFQIIGWARMIISKAIRPVISSLNLLKGGFK